MLFGSTIELGSVRPPSAFPSAFDLGVVLAGWYLLGGALAIAWAEKNLFSELSYQYSTMSFLFTNARSRLVADLDFHQAHVADPPAFARKWAEVQSFLFDLGTEALDENAEWLIPHRARPLEPVMAG